MPNATLRFFLKMSPNLLLLHKLHYPFMVNKELISNLISELRLRSKIFQGSEAFNIKSAGFFSYLEENYIFQCMVRHNHVIKVTNHDQMANMLDLDSGLWEGIEGVFCCSKF